MGSPETILRSTGFSEVTNYLAKPPSGFAFKIQGRNDVKDDCDSSIATKYEGEKGIMDEGFWRIGWENDAPEQLYFDDDESLHNSDEWDLYYRFPPVQQQEGANNIENAKAQGILETEQANGIKQGIKTEGAADEDGIITADAAGN